MGVGDEEQMRKKKLQEQQWWMVLSISNGQRGGEIRPINRTFSTGSGQKPVLKALPRPVALAGAKGVFNPGRKKAEVLTILGIDQCLIL